MLLTEGNKIITLCYTVCYSDTGVDESNDMGYSSLVGDMSADDIDTEVQVYCKYQSLSYVVDGVRIVWIVVLMIMVVIDYRIIMG